ncbi:hypothetical protein FIBSPDRAFT_852834 [Athelia psychrophila]|uniref:Uncharacterized protein n=1 Tax=Athelia psychrophila TaxID=1759441 RepID=A0A166RJ57_9AGAM|nr:hypothetical protein FIBSPDRAFT_852834 [Fibularhizoctonia sp. CBS 109695]
MATSATPITAVGKVEHVGSARWVRRIARSGGVAGACWRDLGRVAGCTYRATSTLFLSTSIYPHSVLMSTETCAAVLRSGGGEASGST